MKKRTRNTSLPENFRTIWLVCLLALSFGCAKRTEEPPPEPEAKKPVNSFSMRVDGQEWKPYQVPDEPCNSTFMAMTGEWRGVDVVPFYEIYAYRDSNGRHDAYSENMLRLVVMNTTKPGTYVIDGTHKSHFDSYVVFSQQQTMGGYNLYVNNPARKPFVVDIDEFLPINGSSTKGMKGTFSGVLYNEDNPADSLVISEGRFTFGIVNAGYDRQCGL